MDPFENEGEDYKGLDEHDFNLSRDLSLSRMLNSVAHIDSDDHAPFVASNTKPEETNISDIKRKIINTDELLKELNKLKASYEELKEENEKYKDEVVELREKLSQSTNAGSINKLHEQINHYKSLNEQLMQRVHNLERELEGRDGNESDKKTIKTLRKDLETKEQELEINRQLLEESYSTIQKLKDKLQKSKGPPARDDKYSNINLSKGSTQPISGSDEKDKIEKDKMIIVDDQNVIKELSMNERDRSEKGNWQNKILSLQENVITLQTKLLKLEDENHKLKLELTVERHKNEKWLLKDSHNVNNNNQREKQNRKEGTMEESIEEVIAQRLEKFISTKGKKILDAMLQTRLSEGGKENTDFENNNQPNKTEKEDEMDWLNFENKEIKQEKNEGYKGNRNKKDKKEKNQETKKNESKRKNKEHKNEENEGKQRKDKRKDEKRVRDSSAEELKKKVKMDNLNKEMREGNLETKEGDMQQEFPQEKTLPEESKVYNEENQETEIQKGEQTSENTLQKNQEDLGNSTEIQKPEISKEDQSEVPNQQIEVPQKAEENLDEDFEDIFGGKYSDDIMQDEDRGDFEREMTSENKNTKISQQMAGDQIGEEPIDSKEEGKAEDFRNKETEILEQKGKEEQITEDNQQKEEFEKEKQGKDEQKNDDKQSDVLHDKESEKSVEIDKEMNEELLITNKAFEKESQKNEAALNIQLEIEEPMLQAVDTQEKKTELAMDVEEVKEIKKIDVEAFDLQIKEALQSERFDSRPELVENCFEAILCMYLNQFEIPKYFDMNNKEYNGKRLKLIQIFLEALNIEDLSEITLKVIETFVKLSKRHQFSCLAYVFWCFLKDMTAFSSQKSDIESFNRLANNLYNLLLLPYIARKKHEGEITELQNFTNLEKWRYLAFLYNVLHVPLENLGIDLAVDAFTTFKDHQEVFQKYLESLRKLNVFTNNPLQVLVLVAILSTHQACQQSLPILDILIDLVCYQTDNQTSHCNLVYVTVSMCWNFVLTDQITQEKQNAVDISTFAYLFRLKFLPISENHLEFYNLDIAFAVLKMAILFVFSKLPEEDATQAIKLKAIIKKLIENQHSVEMSLEQDFQVWIARYYNLEKEDNNNIWDPESLTSALYKEGQIPNINSFYEFGRKCLDRAFSLYPCSLPEDSNPSSMRVENQSSVMDMIIAMHVMSNIFTQTEWCDQLLEREIFKYTQDKEYQNTLQRLIAIAGFSVFLLNLQNEECSQTVAETLVRIVTSKDKAEYTMLDKAMGFIVLGSHNSDLLRENLSDIQLDEWVSEYLEGDLMELYLSL